MSQYNFPNQQATQLTLSGALTNSVTTVVLSAALLNQAAVAAVAPYDIAVVTAGGVIEIMHVTSVAGASVTVTRGYDGTTAIAHLSNESVYPILTGSALANLGAGNIKTGGEITKMQLGYSAVADIAAGTVLTAATWTDVGGNQTFVIDDASSTVLVNVNGGVHINTSGTVAGVTEARIAIDSAGTNTLYNISQNKIYANTGSTNALTGAGLIPITNPGVGSHTVKLQVATDLTGAQLFCQPGTGSTTGYALRIVVLELKR